jgi:hypothetical protein
LRYSRRSGSQLWLTATEKRWGYSSSSGTDLRCSRRSGSRLWLTATEKTWGYSSSSGFYFFDSLT